MKWNSKDIIKRAKKDFAATWEETARIAVGAGSRGKKSGKSPGKPNLIFDTVSKLREAYLKMGFEETVNPVFIEDTEIHKQFGPEAMAVLDRCYYLGGLPRPDIGLSDKRLSEIKKLNVKPDKKALQTVLRRYKTGELSGDDLLTDLAESLKTDDATASKILENFFPELKALKPVPTNITLRSHMTSGWFLSLQALYKKRSHPIRLFSIDRCYRREQSEDVGHLRTYHSASSVVLGDEVSLEDAKDIAKGLLEPFGFKDFRFSLDEKRSKYYAPDTQTEVFGLSPSGTWVEIATYGMYSPIALSRYGIEHPVLNLGLGVERLAMVLFGIEDIREIAYPQFYTGLHLSDEDIARGISMERMPETEEGTKIAEHIIKTARENAMEKSPCSFLAYDGPLLGRRAKVNIVEVEPNTRLLGPAALNQVMVFDGSIYGVSNNKTTDNIMSEGVQTGISYIQSLANHAARNIEESAKEGRKNVETKVKGVKLPSDINLKISDVVVRFINSNNKKIDIRGPVFTTIEAEFS